MNQSITITPSEVLEYNFCPRFIYFMFCLGIKQHEDKRFKVLKGREIHEEKFRVNQGYLRKKIGVIDKKSNIYICSDKLKLRGQIDEVLFLKNGTAAILDYKYAEYKEKMFKTHKMQITQYALLVEEKYNVSVNKGFVCYTRSKNYLHEIDITKLDKQKAKEVITEIFDIIINEKYPKSTKNKAKCTDCCYRNICIK